MTRINLTVDDSVLAQIDSVLDSLGLNRRLWRQEALRMALLEGLPEVRRKLETLARVAKRNAGNA